MHNAVTHIRRHARLLSIALALLGSGSLVLAATGSGSDPTSPSIACAPGGAAFELRGQVPRGVDVVYLGYADGASIQARVVDGAYTLVAPAGSAAGVPDELVYSDADGTHRQQLDGDAFPDCGPPATAVAATAAATMLPPVTGTPRQRAAALNNRAWMHVQRTFPMCRNRLVPKPRLTIGDGTPDRSMLALLGVLRRPPTDEELAAKPGFNPDVKMTIFRRYVRIVHLPGVQQPIRITVGIGQESIPSMALPPCQHKVDRALDRMLKGQPSDVRRIALRFRHGFKLGRQAIGRHPWLDFAGAGGTGGPFDVKTFAKRGLMMEGGGITPPAGFDPHAPGAQELIKHLRPQWEATGLVPDGVATVTLKNTTTGARLGTARVVDNAYFVRLAHSPIRIRHQVMIWRDAAGRTIRVVR